jgi:membrane associated rhomboid family serine protease
MDLLNDLKNTLRSGDNLAKLLIVNIAVFVLVNLLYMVGFLMGVPNALVSDKILNWLAVPASFDLLLFRPWTVITYMFLHEEFLHILFNMLMLYWFGKIFIAYLDPKKLVRVYVLGGLTGAFFYIAAYNLFPVFESVLTVSSALGASAAVLAIVIAIAAYEPNYRIHLLFVGPVKIGYFALFCVLIDLLSIRSGNAGGHIAHLGGAAYGFFFGRSMAKGKDITSGFAGIFDWFKNLFKRKPKMKVTSRRPMSDYDYNHARYERQQEVDRILDKIAKAGYDSLSKEEKEFLFTQGKR